MTSRPASPASAIASPCVQVCTLTPAGGDPLDDACLGCARTRREIAMWTQLSDAERAAVMAALPERARILHDDLHNELRRAADMRRGAPSS